MTVERRELQRVGIGLWRLEGWTESGLTALLNEIDRVGNLPSYTIETEHDTEITVVHDERDRCWLVEQDDQIIVLSYEAMNALLSLIVTWAEGRGGLRVLKGAEA